MHARGILLALALLPACANKAPMPAAMAQTSSLAQHFAPAIADKLEAALAKPGCLWVTDADGTLWQHDIGEGFLQRLIDDHALVSPEAKGIDVWKEYEARVAKDKGTGYAWAAQIMAGMPEAEVRERAAAYAKEFVPKNLYPGMKALLEATKARGCDRWIVSASNQWIVEAAAPLLGLDPKFALGIRVDVKDGRLTSDIVPPVTYKAGKTDAISFKIGATPAIVSGDSAGDTEMLDIATGAALFVEHGGRSDAKLVEAGRAKGWLIQRFD